LAVAAILKILWFVGSNPTGATNMNDYLKDGTTISFRLPDMGDKVYLGIVRGVSTIALPEIGVTYIIEILNIEFPNSIYPYSFIALPETQFKVIHQGFPKPTLTENSILQEGVGIWKTVKSLVKH
jgi:hypothetical protein